MHYAMGKLDDAVAALDALMRETNVDRVVSTVDVEAIERARQIINAERAKLALAIHDEGVREY